LVRIDAPLEVVFAFVDDHRNTTRFLKGLDRWDPLDPEKVQGLGIRFRGEIKVGPVHLGGVLEVIEHVPLERVAYRSIEGPRLDGVWSFRRDRDRTVVELRNSFDLPGGIAGRMVGKVIAAQGQKDLQGSLETLKRLVEEGV
jgi:uncharacterized membrane protein